MDPSPKINTAFFPLDNPEAVKRLKWLFYWFTLTLLFGQLAGILIVLSNHDVSTAKMIGASTLPVLVSLYLIRKIYFEWAATFLALVLLVFITVIGTNGLGIHHISNLGYPVILILASLVTRKRIMIFLTIFVVGCIAWLVFGELWGAYTPQPLVKSVPGDFFSATLIVLITVFMVWIISDALLRSNRQLQQELIERKMIENQREALIKELEMKNAELERFTYTVSHDLKSPLITINGFLGYLEKDAVSNDPTRLNRDVRRISEAVQKMSTLLNELLELSRIGRLVNPPEAIPFTHLVQDALEAVHGRLEAHSVNVTVQPDLPVVYGDRPRLAEVLQNLLENAAKFMGDQANPQIEIGVSGEEDDKSIFYVRDNGIGIAPEFHERIFGLFNKLDPQTEGTGIGLTIVRRIIEVHGGKIWVESDSGKGATFFFTLERG